MAIKEKLPSPSEVAKSIEDNKPSISQSPQQDTPNSEVKFTVEEIEKI